VEDYSTLEILSIYKPPYILDFVEYVSCPNCEMEIDIFNRIVDENSFVYCEDCEHTIRFKLVKI
jgi:hypothetical protein